MTYLTARLNRTRPAVDAIISGQAPAHAPATPAEAAHLIAATLRLHLTPSCVTARGLDNLRSSLGDDYGTPHSVAEVVELVTCPDGRGWSPNHALVAHAAACVQDFSEEERQHACEELIRALLPAPRLDTAPITEGHAWWISLTEARRQEYVDDAMHYDEVARKQRAPSAAVVFEAGDRHVRLVRDGDTLPYDVILCEYVYGEPKDGLGMSDADLTRMSICAALGVA